MEGGRDCERDGERDTETHIHGDVPGHVDVGFVLVHPHLGGSQRVPLGVVVDVVVVGLLGALDVGHSGAGQHLHAASALPHLHTPRQSPQGHSVKGLV